MPVHVDLADFPRLQCRRCGLVALVDPALPLDVRPSLACPLCHGRLVTPRVLTLARRVGSEQAVSEDRGKAGPAASRGSRRPALPVAPGVTPPSNAAVGLTLAALFMLLMIGLFVYLALTPHPSYFSTLTK
jgi:hypothetical protein